jgi:hypothetical protein
MKRETQRPSYESWRSQAVPQVFFPDTADGAGGRVPYVMTSGEVIRFCRLDLTDVKDPELTLRYYREQGVLRGTQIGRELRYLLPDVLDFVEKLSVLNPH